jgi:OOP family OmpA-OmpF porin
MLSLLVLSVIASPCVSANDPGWYTGANIGHSKSQIDDERIGRALLGNGFTSAAFKNDERDTGYKLFGGYQFNKNFALEAGYFNLGKFGFTASTLPPGALNGKIKIKGLSLDAVGILPMTDRFSAFGRIGLNYANTQDGFSGTGAVWVFNPNPSKRELNYNFGLGVQYALTPSLGMRAEAERYRINDAVGNKGDIDLIGISLIYRFD